MLFDSLDEMSNAALSNDLWLGFDDRRTSVERGAMRLLTGLLIGVVFAFLPACGQDASPTSTGMSNTTSPTSATAPATTSAMTTTKSSPGTDAAFTVSVHDVITQINLQLPMIVETGPATKLPATVVKDGVFGGPVTKTAEIYLTSSGNAFNPVRAVVVRVSGTAGSVQTPARLLSGVGSSLHALSADAVSAFRTDVLPRLSAITQTRTTITVGKFYDLTVVVLDQANLAFIFTPIGVAHHLVPRRWARES
jgi:hypothetical protein